MEKKYQIFISSTYIDLIEERKAVQETILSMYQIPIGMEMFSADNEEQWEIIKETIDSSDYYVIIIGHKYGSLTREGISYTRKEYEYACSIGVPTLGFIIDPSVPVKPDYIEVDTVKKEKLDEFIDLVKLKPIQWWKNKEDLSKEVAIAIQKQISRGKRPGWIRANKFDIEETQNELVLLNKKIRELEKENKELHDKIVEKLPDITVELKLPFLIKSMPDTDKEKIRNTINLDYYPISDDEIPKGYENDDKLKDDIKEYNSKLSEPVIDDYIYKSIRYHALKEFSRGIGIIIQNRGTCKANDINISIEIPDNILVEYTTEINQLKKPIPPVNIDTDNPINKLYILPAMEGGLNVFFPFKSREILEMPSFNTTLCNLERKYKIDGNNNIKIWEKNLLHTHNKCIEGFNMAVLNPGKYQLKCIIMCEEYTKPIEQYIELIVE